MNKFFAGYAATAAFMVFVDLIWLGVIAKPLYQQGIGHLMADRPNIPFAVVFYLMFPVGLMLFAVLPNLEQAGWRHTLVAGALFGFFTYATYDLTNLATLKNWPVGLALLDVGWGSLVSAASAGAGRFALNWMNDG